MALAVKGKYPCVGPREVHNLVFYAQSTSMVISGQRSKTKDTKVTRDKIFSFLFFSRPHLVHDKQKAHTKQI